MKKGMSLRIKIVLICVLVTVLISALFYVFNTVFIRGFSEVSSRKFLIEMYVDLSQMLSESDTTTDELAEYIETAMTQQNVNFALQGDSDWEFMVLTREFMSTREREFLKGRLQANMLSYENPGVQIIEKTDNYVLQKVEMPDTGLHYIECYGYMTDSSGTSRKFILSMPMENVYVNIDDSRGFLVLISLSVAFIGVIIFVLVSKRITKPILQLTDISQRMSRLDFSARYTGDSSDEIGLLGNNMNEMSSQLERTILQLQMANETLKKDIEEKNHVDEMRKDFVSNVSHELKTPIALIQGYAEALVDFGDDPESVKYYCEVITDEADKMNRMVKKLTTLTQLEFGEMDMNETSFDLMEMLRDTAEGMQKTAAGKNAEFIVDGPQELTVFGDIFKIQEVVNNYYSNALNHLDEPYRVHVVAEDLGVSVRTSVHNTGAQIPDEALDRLWEKFYKVDKARTRAYGGSGIGLSIVRAIMEAHHGEFGVYNEPDGVTFWFELRKGNDRETGITVCRN